MEWCSEVMKKKGFPCFGRADDGCNGDGRGERLNVSCCLGVEDEFSEGVEGDEMKKRRIIF